MSIKSDRWIRRMSKEHGMIDNVWVQLYPILRSLVKATPK